MTNLDTSPALNLPDSIATLQYKLESEPEKIQLKLVDDLVTLGEAGLDVLMDFLAKHSLDSSRSQVNAKIYQALFDCQTPQVADFLQKHFPTGTVLLKSDCAIDYAPLQRLLAQQDFEAADRLTLQLMCKLAGESAVQRKWIYFTEVKSYPVTDLQTIDALWLAHSNGKFGFSVQREIWLSVGKNWEKLWSKIGWKSGNNWTRYPNEFDWSLDAPKGHLPLSNQLRGVQVIAALLVHPAWLK
ncbi:GUN4 N-terminal ARM-like repeat domain-containing protein [Phormidesmis sp. 146-35]